MRQLLRPVKYLHERSICHRDLKLENCLLLTKGSIEESTLKLVDFGLSCKVHAGEALSTKAGTLGYCSPEMLAGRYNESCDIWSCGVIMFALISGVLPFDAKTERALWQKVTRGNYSLCGEPWRS